jgi:hypothetical protein
MDFKLAVGPRPERELDFTIVIAHRGNPLGLWATVEGSEIELQGSDYLYNYVIISNGEVKKDDNGKEYFSDEPAEEVAQLHKFLSKTGKLGYFEHVKDPLPPPIARQRGASRAEGKTIFFFDNHCLPGRGYFRRALESMDLYKMDMLHSSYIYQTGDPQRYEYSLRLHQNFWGVESFGPHKTSAPYRIAVAGHGGFAVRRDVWFEVGGYWSGFKGYGGEEPYFDLKMALLGKSNWLDPKVVHRHFAGRRGYSRHYTDDYYRNMLSVANIIGGEKWMHKVYESFTQCAFKLKSEKTMFTILREAEKVSGPHAALIASKRLRTLDEQLELFKQEGVSF